MYRKSYKIKVYDRYPHVVHKQYLQNKDWYRVFNNTYPLVLELGTAKGEFIITAALRRPKWNWIGVELRSARLYFAAKAAFLFKIPNVRFLQCAIAQLETYFPPQSIHQFWLTFPDPHPKKQRAKNRMTHPNYLKLYKKLLHPQGTLFLKTDNEKLYYFSLEAIQEVGGKILAKTEDLYRSPLKDDLNTIITGYERTFLRQGAKIFYIAFTL